ncbi:paraquat-inducible protein A [Pedobacter rhodius]|uniref:Paraquat-inducible protein A n=1 Tax=Pedobacter rhodius TaxID=3004098 RepID=A0ABT4KTC7_9SPHI|nr:paraquat-inducible protein A [Pedobacter sp. SJ11]MCZ4222177.1 paraquat-inducible protein A [Pedobacter sp. SJ11]
MLILLLTILLCGEGFFAYRLHILSAEQEQIKEDYSNINNITFGLFSVGQWHDKVAGIINHQVRNFTMTPRQKKELQTEVEQIMLALIDKAEAMVNKPKKTLDGKIKKFVINTFVNTDKIKAQVPVFAKNIIAQVDNPANKKKMSKMAMGKFTELENSGSIDSTLNITNMATNNMYKKYNVSSAEELNNKLTSSLANIRKATYTYCFGMLGCIVVVLSLWWLFRKRVELHSTLFIMSLLFAFILLAVGLTASMIEVDARIKSLDFVLLGEHVIFKDQVLFFQSKSIMDVVMVLIGQPGIDSILVGVLILVFSILFPIMKLSSTGIHLLGNRKLAENKFIKYFAFQSGKWSMADVIVIAILMVYIGLNGLLESQLKSLNIKSDLLTIITTNNTALQPGYIVFISFVLYGLTLSTILKFITPYDSH